MTGPIDCATLALTAILGALFVAILVLSRNG